MNLSEVLSSGSAVGVATTAACAALYKGVRALFEFHEYLRKRRVAYLSYLAAESGESKDIASFVQSVKRESLFAAAFGRPASPRRALAIMDLYDSKLFSLSELRASIPYLRVSEAGLAEFRPGKAGVFIVTLVSSFLLMLGFYMALLAQQLLKLGTPGGFAVAMVFVVLFVLFALFLARDAIEVLIARGIGKRLEAYRAGKLVLPACGVALRAVASATEGQSPLKIKSGER